MNDWRWTHLRVFLFALAVNRHGWCGRPQVNIPILLADGQETVITFIGLGYEKRLMGDTMPVQDRMNTAEIPALPNVRPLGEVIIARSSVEDVLRGYFSNAKTLLCYFSVLPSDLPSRLVYSVDYCF